MNEKPKSIWRKPLKLSGLLMAWLILMAATLFVFLLIFLILGGSFVKTFNLSDLTKTLVASLIVATVAFCLWLFIRWLGCWRNFKRFLFGLACFATLIALFYVEEDWRGKHDWENFKHEWEAKGEHFDFVSVIPPAVPDGQNFAMAPIVASSYETYFDKSGHEVYPRNTNVVDRLSMITWRDNHWAHEPKSENWQTAKKTDLKAWQEYFRSPPPNSKETNSFPIAPQPQTPAADILLALSKYDSAIAEIRAASQLPYSRFPLTYDKAAPFDILLPHLAAVKSCAQAVGLRALAELQNGQSEKAAEDVKLALYLSGSIRTEPFLISQLVRIAMVNIALQPIYEGLAEHKWSDAQLVALNAELAQLNFLADYKSSMRGELGLQAGAIEYLRRQPEQFMNLSAENYSGKALPFPARVIWQLVPSSFFYQNRLNCARMMVEFYLPLADENQGTISKTLTHRADAAIEAIQKHRNPYNLLESMLVPALGGAVEKFAHAQASVDLARTAIALERYRLAHGEFPESLDALAPQFIAQVPHDVINGQPLKYRRTNDGQFVLYSVGWNEKDDGGVVVYKTGSSPEVDRDKGDWVWRYPENKTAKSPRTPSSK
ncbi:MAG TPA: hypothetical protein VIK62_06860 [Verrucomicrobiae bacterium]